MNEREKEVALCKLAVQENESRVREAISDYDKGASAAQDKIVQAHLEKDRDLARLKEELERARTRLAIEKINLQYAEAELARGFEA